MNKSNVKNVLRIVEKLSSEMSEGMYMDNAMDGSGDCGGIIANHWCNWFNNRLNQALKECNVTIDEVRKTANEWALKELEMGPKQVWISMYSKTDGMYKEKDYLDTKWGEIAFTIANTTEEYSA